MHMISYDQRDRIPTVSLYYCLKNIQNKLHKGVKTYKQEHRDFQDQMYTDVFYGQYD